MEDEEFSVEVPGKKSAMSRAQFHRKIRALNNQSPSEFLRAIRLQRTADLLRKDADNVAEIVYRVGVCSQAYFTNVSRSNLELMAKRVF